MKLGENTGVSHVRGWAEVRHGYMPVGGQEALIVPPRGVQVGPGAVGGVITPRSLVQHGGGQGGRHEVGERGRKWRSMWEHGGERIVWRDSWGGQRDAFATSNQEETTGVRLDKREVGSGQEGHNWCLIWEEQKNLPEM